MTRRRPPSLAGRLLERLDPTGTVRGDLDEEYRRYRSDRSRPAADLWYWGQTIRSLPHLITTRRRDRGPGLFRIALGQAIAVLRRRPGHAAVVVVTFALAMGVNTAVFSLVQSVLLRDLPFANEERLVRLHPDELFYTGIDGARRVAEASRSAERILPWGRTLFTLTETEVAQELRGGLVAHDHFQGLGAVPALGRAFRPEDAEAWPAPPLILSHGAWVRTLGGDPGVVGQAIAIGGGTRILVGVMGPEHVPMEPDWEAWAPLPTDVATAGDRALALNALVRPGVDPRVAADDLRGALATAWSLDGMDLTSEEIREIGVIPLRDHLLGSVRTPLAVLTAAGLFVLLLACANVANLLLAQGATRGTEWAVRTSLGAGRTRLVAQSLAEVLLLAAAGGVLGLLLALGFQGWASGRLPADLPRAGQWSLGTAAMLYTVVASLGVAVLAGGIPAWWAARDSAASGALRRSRSSGGRGLSTALVGVQTAAAVVLVVGAGLMIRSFVALSEQDPGFQAEGVVAVRVAPPHEGVADDRSRDAFYRQVVEAAEAHAALDAVGGILFLPMTPGGAWSSFRREEALAQTADLPSTAWRTVIPGYFQAMGIPLLAGRTPDVDDGPETEAVAAINQTLARQAFGDDDPVGRRLYLGGGDEPEAVRVVGVVGDVRQTNQRADVHPELYRPLAQSPMNRMYVVARTSSDEGEALAALQDAILSVDDRVVLSRAAPLRDVVAETYADTRLLTELLGLFSVLAIALGGVGIYGVTARAVAARRREMAIRLALGADPGRVTRGTLGSGLLPVAGGTLTGLTAAALLARMLDSLLYGIEPLDPTTFMAVAGVLAAVAGLALVGPAVRAGRTDPMGALQSEP